MYGKRVRGRNPATPQYQSPKIAWIVSVNLAIDAEIPAVKDEHWGSSLLASGFVESRGLIQVFATRSVDDSDIRLIRDVDGDKVFLSSGASEKRQHTLWRSVPYPLSLTLLQRWMRSSDRDELLIKREKVCSSLGDRPENRQLLEQRRRAGFSCVANLHAVIKHRHAIHSKDQRGSCQSSTLAEAGNGALFVMVVGKAHLQRAFGIAFLLRLPVENDGLSGRTILEHIGYSAVKRPGIVQVKGFHEQLRLIGFRDHDEVRLDLHQFCPSILPEVGGHLAGNVAAKSVQVEISQPVLQHVGHITAQLEIPVVESGHIRPLRIRRNDVALSIFLIELRVFHEDAVPGGMVRNDVD